MPSNESAAQASYSAAELADAVNEWCARNGVRPLSEQASPRLTERNIHYYRSIGLISAPSRGRGRGYGERQFLQLVGVRLLQAQGLPLRRIQELLYGRNLAELRKIRDRGMTETHRAPMPAAAKAGFSQAESWHMMMLDEEHMLVNRSGHPLDPEKLRLIREILRGQATGKGNGDHSDS